MSEEKPAKNPFEEMYVAAKKAQMDAEAERDREKDEKKRAQNEASRLRRKYEVESEKKEDPPPSPPPITVTTLPPVTIAPVSTPPAITNTPPPAPVEDAHPPKHSFKTFQAACTTCGEKNPVYKAEMACDKKKGGCGNILGSFESVLEMNNCPFCSKSVNAVPITSEAMQKARAHLAKTANMIPA